MCTITTHFTIQKISNLQKNSADSNIFKKNSQTDLPCDVYRINKQDIVSVYLYVVGLTLIFLGRLQDSNLLANVTLLPKRQ